MNDFKEIIQGIGLFRHFTGKELDELRSLCTIEQIDKGSSFDLRKAQSLIIPLGGMLEAELPGKSGNLFLSTGSVIGEIPFTQGCQGAMVKALTDTPYASINSSNLHKFLIRHYKALRGYLSVTGKLGFQPARGLQGRIMSKTRIITVCAPQPYSGKSFFASLLGLSLAQHGKTIVLDLSYKGQSIFEFFEKKILPPISQRQVNNPDSSDPVNDKMQRISDNLNILNVAHNSKVRVDPGILSPLLFMLSNEYNYIILDTGCDDAELRNEAIAVSDMVFTMLKNRKDRQLVHGMYDGIVRSGQRVYYVANQHYMRSMKNFRGGFILPRYPMSKEEGIFYTILTLSDSGAMKDFIHPIIKTRRACVLGTNLFESLYYAGFLHAARNMKLDFDVYYTSSMAYLILVMFLLNTGKDAYLGGLLDIFSEKKINKLFSYVFRDDFIFRSKGITKIAHDIAGAMRVEEFSEIPAAMICSGNNDRELFTTGPVADILAASLLHYPIFEPQEIAGSQYHSGYPFKGAVPEDMIAAGFDEIYYVSVDSIERFGPPFDRISAFYRKYINQAYRLPADYMSRLAADRTINLSFPSGSRSIARIFETSEETAMNLLKG